MPTIDLATPPPPPSSPLGGAPRRLGLTLPELQRVAALAGDAPLPFEPTAPEPVAGPGSMASRLGDTPASAAARAHREILAGLPDPAESLARRGLLTDGGLDEGVAGAVGLLATPDVALDLDVTMGGMHVKAWHRQGGRAVATLATIDGVVFELAWFGQDAWVDELGRVAVIAEDVALTESSAPAYVDLPYELIDGAVEAIRAGRGDLVPVLVSRHRGTARGADDERWSDLDVVRVLTALTGEARGRLRGMVADLRGGELSVVGVVSWTLLADGWRALRPHREADGLRVEIRRVTAADLPTVLAPVLAETAR
jgi:hypothetical protein